jgi:dihydrolipoamide dehydrogenase
MNPVTRVDMPTHDLLVIGAGPGGYVAAIRAAQLGMNVGCVDASPQLGGTCLRIGCIPSKALLESSEKYAEVRGGLREHGISVGDVQLNLAKLLQRKDRVVDTLTKGVASLFRKHGIQHYRGHGRFENPTTVIVEGDEPRKVQGKHVLIATGSKPAGLPGVPLDGERIGTSTEALAYDSIPERLIVIGGGYIGLELGAVWSRLGSQVKVLEFLDRILPGTDAEIAAEARKIFEKQGLEFRLGSRVVAASVENGECIVDVAEAANLAPVTRTLEASGSLDHSSQSTTAATSEPDELQADRLRLRSDRVLVAVGRVPNTDGLNLEAIGVETDRRGFIPVNEQFETAAAGVYAIGDVIGHPMLAHKAEDEGLACVEWIATGYGHVNYNAIPAIVYTHPEIAAVGRTEEQLREQAVEYSKGAFPFRANGRARALGMVEGFVKVLADRKTDRILGVHILGARAGDLIAEAAAAIEFGASSEDLARTPHAHPTLSEALREACLAAGGRVIHV